jgi:hypothetical protein
VLIPHVNVRECMADKKFIMMMGKDSRDALNEEK